MKIQSSSIVTRSSDVLFSQLDDELLAIDAPKGFFYSMNETGGRVWVLIDQPTTVNDLCARLSDEFTIDEKTCLRDVLQLLQGLHDAGLVKVDGS